MAKKRKEDRKILFTRSYAEFRRALYSTVLIFIVSLCLYFSIPWLQRTFFSESHTTNYKRIYHFPNWGAEIVYQTKEKEKTARLKKDLEILSRRFLRADFQILTLPTLSQTSEYKKVKTYAKLYLYQIKEEGYKVNLEIRVKNNNPVAIQALHQYLSYLDNNWK